MQNSGMYRDIRTYWKIYDAEFRLWKLKILCGICVDMPEFRFNPNHDPTNGRFTSGNFSSSAIRFSGGGASKGLTTGGKDDIIKATTQQRQDIKNTLKGTKTPNGIIISNVSQHAADRIIERGYSADDIKKSLTNAAITYPGNTSGTHCVQLKADDRIVYNDKGNVVTVVKLGKE